MILMKDWFQVFQIVDIMDEISGDVFQL